LKRIKQFLLIFVLFLMLFVISGCDSEIMRNFSESLAEGIKNAFKQTWWIWLIIVLVLGFIAFLVEIAKRKARVKMIKHFKDKIQNRKKKEIV